MAMPNGTELLVIVAVAVLLFGPKKIPELAKGLGQGIRNFKNEMKDHSDEHPPSEPSAPMSSTTSQESKPVDIISTQVHSLTNEVKPPHQV